MQSNSRQNLLCPISRYSKCETERQGIHRSKLLLMLSGYNEMVFQMINDVRVGKMLPGKS